MTFDRSKSDWKQILAVALVAIVAVIGFNSFVVINPGEAGVVSILGKAADGVLLEGVHFKPPLAGKVDIYDLTIQKFEVPAQSSTKDLQDLTDRKSTRLNSSHVSQSRMPSSA